MALQEFGFRVYTCPKSAAETDLGMAVFENTDGKDFPIGFYDGFNKKHDISRVIKKSEMAADTYKLYKLNGETKLSPECLVSVGQWLLSVKLGHLCSVDNQETLKNEWEVYLSLKFEAPDYSRQTNQTGPFVIGLC